MKKHLSHTPDGYLLRKSVTDIGGPGELSGNQTSLFFI
jgi:hypothetical protein